MVSSFCVTSNVMFFMFFDFKLLSDTMKYGVFPHTLAMFCVSFWFVILMIAPME